MDRYNVRRIIQNVLSVIKLDICCNTKVREAYEINCKSDQRIVFLNEVNKPIQDQDWNKEVQIQIRGYKKNVVMKIDTGASVTVIPYRSSFPNIRPSKLITKGLDIYCIWYMFSCPWVALCYYIY